MSPLLSNLAAWQERLPLATTVFLLAFVFNFVWEQLHSMLYVHFKGGPITQYVLLRATIIDAVLITGFFLVISLIPLFKKRPLVWLAVFGLTTAVGIEWYALATNRWAYNSLMPIIPLIHTGLTPTIQLLVLGLLSITSSQFISQLVNPTGDK